MRKFYIEKLLEMDDVYLDYPFDDVNWAAIRHTGNKKIFALIFDYKSKTRINFKNSPDWGTFWRGSFESVEPAYHMNKEHWSMVTPGGDADTQQILQMISDSYNLTKPKIRKRQKNEC